MTWLQSLFSTPARQALGWTLLGILGIGMATGGVFFLTDDGGGSNTADAGNETAVATNTASPTAPRTSTATPSATASPTPTETPSPTATTRPVVAANPGGNTGGGNSGDGGAQEPAPTPTPEPVVAGGDYCPNSSSSSPPNSVFGIFTIAGAPAPAGSPVSLAFDGVLGPTRLSTAAGGYRVDYFSGSETCANRVGAAISVVYNGVHYPTGRVVGDSPGAPVTMTLAVP